LYRIMSRVFIDKLRKKTKLIFRSIDQPIYTDNNDYFIEIADESNSPEQVLLAKDLDDKIQKALQMMPIVFRMTVIYADIEGMSYEEVAEATGASMGTVRSRLHRGRKMLRELIGDLGESV